MIITPQARRLITGAVRALPDARSQKRWEAWAGQAGPSEIRDNVPYDIAEIALEALTETERGIEERLGQKALDEDLEADLLNDLAYVQSIEAALRNEGVGR